MRKGDNRSKVARTRAVRRSLGSQLSNDENNDFILEKRRRTLSNEGSMLRENEETTNDSNDLRKELPRQPSQKVRNL